MESSTPITQRIILSIHVLLKKTDNAPKIAPIEVEITATTNPTSKAFLVENMARSKISWPSILVLTLKTR